MLYQFKVELSDVDRGIYETLDFRIVQHPSEAAPYLLTRALAYALSYQANLEFSPAGLGDPETPALWAKSNIGNLDLWIEVGSPSARKLHKATKAADQVLIYTYKNPDLLVADILENKVHRAREVQIFALDPKFLALLERELKKSNRWSLLLQNGQIDLGTGTESYVSDVRRITFPQP